MWEDLDRSSPRKVARSGDCLHCDADCGGLVLSSSTPLSLLPWPHDALAAGPCAAEHLGLVPLQHTWAPRQNTYARSIVLNMRSTVLVRNIKKHGILKQSLAR